MTYDEFQEHMAEVNPEALFADGLEAAAIGYTLNHHNEHVVVYDYDLCVLTMMADGMTEDEADEYLGFNTLGAYVGPHGPLYVKVLR